MKKIIVLLFCMITVSFSQEKIISLAPDTLPPANLPIENTPQFIFIGCDDNASSNYFDIARDLKNPAGRGQARTYDGAPVRFSFFLNYYNPSVTSEGHEFGLHTQNHIFVGNKEDAIDDFGKNLEQVPTEPKKVATNCRWDNAWICDTILALPAKVSGVRAPYLYVSDWVFDALDELDLRYDCSLEEGMSPRITSPNGFVYPYTADNGATPGWLYLSDTVGAQIAALGMNVPNGYKGSIPNQLKPHPGKWELPAYPLFVIPDSLKAQYGVGGDYAVNPNFGSLLEFNFGKGELGNSVDGKKISGMDFDMRHTQGWDDHQAAMTLLYNLKLRLAGNRVPMTYLIHGGNGIGLKEFIDSALAYPEVRFVTGNQLIDWMENPVGLDGTVGGRKPDTCATFEVPFCNCGEETVYDTIICGLENIRAYEDSVGHVDCEKCIPLPIAIKQRAILQNKGFVASLVGGDLNIALENGKFADIAVFDTRGKLILRQVNVKNNTKIPFVCQSGVYFVKAVSGKKTMSQKIMVK